MPDRQDPIADAVLIQTWMSPAFPTGGFSYSHALETLVEDGRVTTPDDVSDWLLHRFDTWQLLDRWICYAVKPGGPSRRRRQ